MADGVLFQQFQQFSFTTRAGDKVDGIIVRGTDLCYRAIKQEDGRWVMEGYPARIPGHANTIYEGNIVRLDAAAMIQELVAAHSMTDEEFQFFGKPLDGQEFVTDLVRALKEMGAVPMPLR
ncbi:hypothetical protein KEM55_003327 [Ascosphaera atra]|nr:hypothetical protein KEM55_003327 [Ascosphaera atra]